MKKGGSSKGAKQQAAIALSMKAKGKKPKMEGGGPLKPVPSDKQKSLGQLPTSVRNKMGYQKHGGPTKMKMGGSCVTPKSLRKGK